MDLVKIVGVNEDELIRMVALYCSASFAADRAGYGVNSVLDNAAKFEQYIKKGYGK